MGIIKNTLYHISNKRLLPLFKNQFLFPYYHIVRDNKVAHIENLYPYKNTIQFKNDLEVLLKNYTPINPDDLIQHKSQKNTFLISFDDGLEEIYSVVYPILKEKGLSAIFFINPVYVDNNIGLYKHYISIIISHLKQRNFDKNLLDKISKIFYINYETTGDFISKFKNIPYSERNKINDIFHILNFDIEAYLKEQKPYVSKVQIQEMMNDGFFFGGHTMTHPPLNKLSVEEQKTEIIGSIEWLKLNFGISYSLFAFPFSDKNISRKLLNELFQYDQNILLFGNSGLKKDIDNRIIQRVSFENPTKQIQKHIVTENLYKCFNQITGKYQIKRK
ncbi:hypothetical protein FNO01nite_03320 [Flavobacterium noncentrifugens]|uniref:Polysaccharide deacetylase n=1 Tax=Flavobacterium noncentrifugens TaxID=1128970 RepID=A0A1G8S182_9FLAO|nr:polysaccharide deacetylase family protein [Flavobacterium noncentrifugens]GEP49660.1 hypothetical protein FNO01nite_03320 [Flavobacterium noncentrifugens]SDJ22969.1 Polysaccharide deacetylase [Flavobacterium noncentrifugens]